MVVNDGRGGIQALIGTQFHLLTGDTAQCGDLLAHALAVHLQGYQGVEVSRLLVHSEVQDSLGEVDKLLVLGNKVGLTLEGDDCSELAVGLADGDALSCLTVFTLGGDGLTALANQLHGLGDVVVALDERLLAVAQACAGHVAQFLDVIDGYSHNSVVVN